VDLVIRWEQVVAVSARASGFSRFLSHHEVEVFVLFDIADAAHEENHICFSIHIEPIRMAWVQSCSYTLLESDVDGGTRRLLCKTFDVNCTHNLDSFRAMSAQAVQPDFVVVRDEIIEGVQIAVTFFDTVQKGLKFKVVVHAAVVIAVALERMTTFVALMLPEVHIN
jgi:hypothetical protein